MANRHFANIGDIWKHLPLAEILTIESPSHYWESHAGSAEYPLTHSLERDYGVFYFIRHAPNSMTLRSSAYLRVLKRHKRDGKLISYPGSPRIALALLQQNEADLVFCDIDRASLAGIRATAIELGFPERTVLLIDEDGISTLVRLGSQIAAPQAPNTFALIDPYLPLESANGGFNSVELFSDLSTKNIKVMLWYGYESHDTRNSFLTELTRVLAADKWDVSRHNLWCGDISLAVIGDRTFNERPGVLGCGIVCSNLSSKSTSVCDDLGKSLAKIYERATFPQGHTGAIEYNSLQLL
jgi:23S rRNA (adenine2030-N6)-methyltransferase